MEAGAAYSQSLERGLAILSAFKSGRPLLGVSDLAVDVGLSRSTAHRYIATRVPELVGRENSRRVISCHLGGSSSICAIENGRSVANSFGMTAQSGVPHNNRVGDFDTFAIRRLTKQGLGLEEIFAKLSKGPV